MNVPEKYSKNKIVYQDVLCTAILCNGAKGHIKIFSNNPFLKIDEISSDVSVHMFFLANFCATSCFENLGASGTNIIVNNDDTVFCIDIIPRYENDGLNFMWDLKPGIPTELDTVASQIRDDTILIESKMKESAEQRFEPKGAGLRSEPEGSKKEPEKKEEKKEEHKVEKIVGRDNRLISDMPLVPKEYLDEEEHSPDIHSKEDNYLISELRRIP
jgi:diadenosine tetraphosphate (Ap4A) HIT family hydrolase